MRKFKNILILAGGDSTRFWPLNDKVLFPFLGKPLINYIIDQIFSYTNSIVVVSHPNNKEKVKNIFGQKVYVIAQEETNLGMAGAVLAAKDIIGNDEVLVINGSDILDFCFLKDFIKKVENFNQVVITAKEMKDNFPGGYLKFDDNGRLIEIVEKPKIPPSYFFKLVADYFFNLNFFLEKIINLKNKVKDDCLYEEGLNLMIKESKKTAVFYYKKDFYSLKYPWHVLVLMNYFLKKVKKNYFGKNIFISKKAIIKEPVYFSDGVRIGDYSKVVGPSFLGKNSIVADYALVNKSHIGNDCLIGGYSEVTRSYLGNRVFLHRNYVGDSVLADGVLLGAGAVLANFRFDGYSIGSLINNKKVNTGLLKLGAIIGQESKLGINSSVLPGIKIGRKTYIGPGQLVTKDVFDNKFLFNNQLKDNHI